jgi:hypothetical protein
LETYFLVPYQKAAAFSLGRYACNLWLPFPLNLRKLRPRVKYE